MKRTVNIFFSLLMLAIFCSGCLVAESKYLTKVDEADTLAKQASALAEENASLKQQIASLSGQRQDLLIQTGNLSKSEADNRQKIAELEAENAKLKDNLSQLTKKTQEVEKASNTYKELLQEMKGEIAKGEVTITELKGKLTMDVVDKILFASGEAKVKKEGLDVLSRLVEILKNLKDKNIRVEGHTDNIKITSRLAKQFPTNWELSSARALNVTKYLQEQGIDPKILSATAFGEYQPIGDNETPEGRAKNRRIAIILLPKD